jgi:hypothetical protein
LARATGLSRTTLHKAVWELEGNEVPPERVRKAGGGRKPNETVECGSTKTALRDRNARFGPPLSPRPRQVEQDRASHVQLHHQKLAGETNRNRSPRRGYERAEHEEAGVPRRVESPDSCKAAVTVLVPRAYLVSWHGTAQTGSRGVAAETAPDGKNCNSADGRRAAGCILTPKPEAIMEIAGGT